MVYVRVDDLTAESASLAAGPEQEKAEREVLANLIQELEADAVRLNGELGVIV